MNETTTILEAERITAGYGEEPVFREISFAVRQGEIFVIMGPSGCGKTTLLKSLVRLIEPLSGEVWFRGRKVSDPRVLREFRRASGMVFQGGALLNSSTLAENVALPLREHTSIPPALIRQVVWMKLAQVGLLEARHLMPMEVSGGMRKRAGIARALVMEPAVIFFDEPTGGLDPITADGIDNLILSLRDELGVTIVIVTHELPSIFKVADRVMMLRDGAIAVLADREGVRASPDEGVQRFVTRTAEPEEGTADAFLEEVEGGGT